MKRIIKTALAIVGTKYVLLRAIGKLNRSYYTSALGGDYTDLIRRNRQERDRIWRIQTEELIDLCETKGEHEAAEYARLWLTAWDWADEKLKR